MYAECDDEAQAGDAMDVEARRVHALVAEFKQVQLAHIGQAREVATFSQDKFCTESEIAQTMARFNQATEDQRKDKFCIQPKLAAGVAALNNAEPVYTGQRVALQGKARGSFKTRRGECTEGNTMRVQQWRAKEEKFSIQSKVAAGAAAFSHDELRSRVATPMDYSLMGTEDVEPLWAPAITKRTRKRKREEKPKKKEKEKPKKKEKEKPKKKEKEKPKKKEKEKPKKEEKPKEKEKPKKKKKKEKPKKKKGNAKKAKAKKEEDSNDEEEEERYFLFFKMMSYITRSQSMKVLCTKF